MQDLCLSLHSSTARAYSDLRSPTHDLSLKANTAYGVRVRENPLVPESVAHGAPQSGGTGSQEDQTVYERID